LTLRLIELIDLVCADVGVLLNIRQKVFQGRESACIEFCYGFG
jgi:hypothetical protein